MKKRPAQIVRELGPFPEVDMVHGVTFDGEHVWFASGEQLNAVDPETGERVRSIDIAAQAGTAFDGRYLYQIGNDCIQKVDPKTGQVLSTIPAPGAGADTGLAWADGVLWVGDHRGRKIHQIDPQSGQVLRSLASNQVVTGVTWVDAQLWHGALQGEDGFIRRVDPESGEVVEQIEMPSGMGVTGLESDGAELFFCGGGNSGKLRVVRRR